MHHLHTFLVLVCANSLVTTDASGEALIGYKFAAVQEQQIVLASRDDAVPLAARRGLCRR
jgi:hypothetical protein